MFAKYSWAILALPLVLLFSCGDDEEPMIINQEELITTLTYDLTPVDGGTTVQISFQDLDGDGDGAPVVVGGTLAANTEYNGTIGLLDQSTTPEEVITTEVQEEDDEHQLFFSTAMNLTISYEDMDENSLPLGLQTKLTTGDAEEGNLTITLIHEPEKTESGVSAGDITNAGGETDIQVTIPIKVE